MDSTDTNTLPELPEGAVWQPDGTVLFTLAHPVRFEGSNERGNAPYEVTELRFKRITGGDMIDSSNLIGSGARTQFLLCACTGNRGPVGEKVIRGLDADDYLDAYKIADFFTGGGRRTGRSASRASADDRGLAVTTSAP